jgi:hypothetical protein
MSVAIVVVLALAVIAAMGSTSEAAFVCWTGRPGDADVAAGPSPEEDVPAG